MKSVERLGCRGVFISGAIPCESGEWARASNGSRMCTMKRTLQLAAIFLVVSSFSLAQIHGIGASATSVGPHNMTPGIPASVTSLGPQGFGNGGAHFGQHFGPGVNTTVVVGSG